MRKIRGRETFGGEGDLNKTPLLPQIYSWTYKLCSCWITRLPGFFKRCSVGSKTDSSSSTIYKFSVFLPLLPTKWRYYFHSCHSALTFSTFFANTQGSLWIIKVSEVFKWPVEQDKSQFFKRKKWQHNFLQWSLYKIEPLNMFYGIGNHLYFGICIGGRNQKDFLA